MQTNISDNKPILGILLGDAAGVGPEIVAKVAAKGALQSNCRPIIIGEVNVLGDLWASRVTSHIPVKEIGNKLSVENIMRAIKLAAKNFKACRYQ